MTEDLAPPSVTTLVPADVISLMAAIMVAKGPWVQWDEAIETCIELYVKVHRDKLIKQMGSFETELEA